MKTPKLRQPKYGEEWKLGDSYRTVLGMVCWVDRLWVAYGLRTRIPSNCTILDQDASACSLVEWAAWEKRATLVERGEW